MTILKISEADCIQFSMVKHTSEIGWTPLTSVDVRRTP